MSRAKVTNPTATGKPSRPGAGEITARSAVVRSIAQAELVHIPADEADDDCRGYLAGMSDNHIDDGAGGHEYWAEAWRVHVDAAAKVAP